jgi:hypothetical protein
MFYFLVTLGLDPEIHLKNQLDSRLRGNDKYMKNILKSRESKTIFYRLFSDGSSYYNNALP